VCQINSVVDEKSWMLSIRLVARVTTDRPGSVAAGARSAEAWAELAHPPVWTGIGCGGTVSVRADRVGII
jgi:hypothetical protein